MKWVHVQTDKLPKDKQSVLLSVNGIYYEAEYSGKENLFLCKKHENISFSPKFDNFYWTDFVPPGE